LCPDDRVVLGDPCLRVPDGVALARLPYNYRYAPPELFRAGEAPGPTADFYALGCVAYELFCGRPPFISDSHHELANQHVHAPVRFDDLAPQVKGPAQAFLSRLLAKSPTERFRAVDELISALDRLTERPAGSGRFPPRPEPVLRTASLVNYRAGQSVVGFDVPAPPAARHP